MDLDLDEKELDLELSDHVVELLDHEREVGELDRVVPDDDHELSDVELELRDLALEVVDLDDELVDLELVVQHLVVTSCRGVHFALSPADREQLTEEDLDYTWASFKGLPAFFARAAEAGGARCSSRPTSSHPRLGSTKRFRASSESSCSRS